MSKPRPYRAAFIGGHVPEYLAQSVKREAQKNGLTVTAQLTAILDNHYIEVHAEKAIKGRTTNDKS